MYLGGRGPHAGTHTIVDSDSGRDEGVERIFHLGHVLALLEEPAQDHLVDVLEGLGGWLRQGQHAGRRRTGNVIFTCAVM